MTREENAERAKSLLRYSPMTRFDLECRLGISQQRISEALRDVGACVIGHEPAAGKGQPAPIYALEPAEVCTPAHAIGAVCSVWQLGSLA
jgi:hypothetical protein